ncbi:SCP-like extracellular [Methanococcus vannielii SB]|uniref:SCP-like extracellular n=1 Tax=Methanococcus vannielii (strain ATCC 35089 / DSM 1224 / JCM 13029 / OCM 148 / SB) TaxID=406327 RepID=A6UQ83_METVS|nr:CAP domain-containing protein [Methanococcus vannielii]ABR54655.1 SCP-like extracellular [Methanococcus vannielii SB]
MNWLSKVFTLTVITISLLTSLSAELSPIGCENIFNNLACQNFNENHNNLLNNRQVTNFQLTSILNKNIAYQTYEVRSFAPLKRESSKTVLIKSRQISINQETSPEVNTGTNTGNTGTNTGNTGTNTGNSEVKDNSENVQAHGSTIVVVRRTTSNTPKVEEPKVEEPKVEEPKVEEPKVEEPKVEEPKVEEPKVEEPKVEEPITDMNAQIGHYILIYTNRERASHGLNAFILDERLNKIAQDHSNDMVKNNYFSHTSLDGKSPTDRAVSAGYDVKKSLGNGYFAIGIGENIAKMPTGNVLGIGHVSNDAQSVAKATVDAWMNSPGHRANILSSRYTRIGIGVAFDGRFYVETQNFF